MVLLFACDDPFRWEYLGIWATGEEPVLDQLAPADVWECPQLVDLGNGRVALVVSLHDRGVLGSVMAATGVLTDEGGVPRFRADQAQLLDTGNAYYAPQVAADPDPGAWTMGWVRQDGDPDLDQVGCMSLPRRLVADGNGCLLRLDPRVAALVEPTVLAVAPGVLRHPELGELELPEGSKVFVDGDVTEVYRPGLAPHTTRHEVAWQVGSR